MKKSKEKQYDIHEDYQGLPRITLNFFSVQIPIINGLHAIIRKFSALNLPKDVLSKTIKIDREDGPPIKSIMFEPRDKQGKKPLLVYFHGGGFAITYSKKHIEFCRKYAIQTGCSVMLVDYRLTPMNGFPKPFNDGYTSLEWAISNADTLNIDKSKIAVGGDSAGGCIAAGVAQKSLDNNLKLCGQLLVYPALDYRCITESANIYKDVPIWNSESNRRMWKAYLGNSSPWAIPEYASPGLRENLFGLPDTYIETAEFDPLRDEGKLYSEKLTSANVVVTTNNTKKTVHGYDSWGKSNKYSQRAFIARIEFLKKIFSKPLIDQS